MYCHDKNSNGSWIIIILAILFLLFFLGYNETGTGCPRNSGRTSGCGCGCN